MQDDIHLRVRRIYTSLNATEERNPEKLKGSVVAQNGSFFRVSLDFGDGISVEELSNYAHTLIHNIANLEHNLRKWAHHNSKEKSKVDDLVKGSDAIRIIKDLSNNDKHGYGIEKSHSGMRPKLKSLHKARRLVLGNPMYIHVKVGENGEPEMTDDGNGFVIISGEIVNADGEYICGLYDTCVDAIQDWESVLKEYEINVNGI